MRWFRIAADQGYDAAEAAVGVMYLEGRGVQKDIDEAVRWLRRAAAQGNEEARARLAELAR
ncbi:SEL1-like repeat protein [Inquilinus limosus]|uniref:hypothetical protein n=1 Tax=Inquilinus limosus TaxID=171674 RepID=UPI003F153271